ncbi:MAG TPA: T9SS type A sorting domain-containing protein [Bacteroidia bacterium]|nr:T9SS type A sorting domain-containing protein [Bacteroidia bacterium]
MKKLLIFLYFTFYIFNSAFSQNPLVKQWDKRFGGTNYEHLTCLQQTVDGGYILGGLSFSNMDGDKTQPNWDTISPFTSDYWIVKIDSLGSKQWEKTYGGTNKDRLYSLMQTTDRGYILGGFSYSGLDGDKTQPNWDSTENTTDYWIIKIDSLGNKQWDKVLGGTDSDYLFSLQETSDRGYILGGYSYSGIDGDKTQPNWDSTGNTTDFWIVKADSSGNKQWDKDFGGTSSDRFLSLQQTADGGYILGGNSDSDSSGNKTQNTWGNDDFWIIKTDSFGSKQWDKDFGGTYTDHLYSLRQTTDGGFILGGLSQSGISGDKSQISWGGYDYWIVKIDSVGSKQWDKDFGGTDLEDDFGNVTQTTDNGYLIAGTSYSPISGNKTENNLGLEQVWLVKTDSSGNLLYDKTIFTLGHDEEGFALQTKDRCYAIANMTQGGIGGYKTQPNWDPTNIAYDYWIIKFCDTTATTSFTQLPNPQSPFSIYPNPSNGSFQVSGLKFPVERIEIFNLLGETVFEHQPETRNSSEGAPSGKLETHLANGMYIIIAYTDKGIFQQKLLVQK